MSGGPGIGLAAAKAPPFRLPGEHFAAGMIFLVLGGIGLVIIARDVAAGAYPLSAVVAVTHLFTLGWITMSIMGALYQFLPVALGEPIRSVAAGHLAFALYAPGVAVFTAGLALDISPLMLIGAASLGTGLLIFIVNLGATLLRATARDLTWWALLGADLFLLVTLILGLALAANRQWGVLAAARPVALGTHLHVALFGWILLVIVGVVHRLLPMFLLSHGAGDRFARAAVGLLAAGAAMLAVGHHGPALISRWLPALLFGGGLVALLLQARAFYRHRHRPALDPGMRSAGLALGVLAVALVLAGVALLIDRSPRASLAYVMALVLGISLFVAALYYKIVPFLVWYHRFGPLAGKRKISRVSDLYSARLAGLAGALLLLGVALLLAGVIAARAEVVVTGALILTAGVTVEAIQMFALARRTP